MRVKTETVYDVKYGVSYFEGTEGGMDSDDYGEPVDDLAKALHLLDLAKAASPQYGWVIVLDVKKETKEKS